MVDLKKEAQKLWQLLKKFLILSRGAVTFFGWVFYDFYLCIKRDKSIGAHIHILNKHEARFVLPKTAAGGYSLFKIIKIFTIKQFINDKYDETAIEIINHEVLHQVIRKTLGKWSGIYVSSKFDRIHKAYILINVETKCLELKIDFIDFLKQNLR